MNQSIINTPDPSHIQTGNAALQRDKASDINHGRNGSRDLYRGRGRGSNRRRTGEIRPNHLLASSSHASMSNNGNQVHETLDPAVMNQISLPESGANQENVEPQILNYVGRNRGHFRRERNRKYQPPHRATNFQQNSRFGHTFWGNERYFHSQNCSTSRTITREAITEGQNLSVGLHDEAQAKVSRKIPPRRFMRDRNTDPTESSDTVQSEISENRFKSNTFECMICCDDIHRNNQIWYCNSCYNIFHMKCAVEWCNKSIKSRDEAIASSQFPSLGGSDNSGPRVQAGESSNSNYPNYRHERQKSVEWPCPTCRKVLHSRPGKYKCFCGKVVQPEIYRHLTPHSCGQLCGRKRPNDDCSHPCDSICHPGRCNLCQLTSKKSCYCGKLTKEVKCSTNVGSCEEVCDKKLDCGRHHCLQKCHIGNCSPCNEILTIQCYCGSKEISKRCGDQKRQDKITKIDEKFSCDKICDDLLDCGKHRCLKRCHKSECSSCPLLSKNLKSCPCGTMSISKSSLDTRTSCTDPLPTCASKCNRQLICGPEKNRHRCQRKCHVGYCPPCKLKSSVKCECSTSTTVIECSLTFEKILDAEQNVVGFRQINYHYKCEARCNSLKNCGKHRCQEKCCDANRNLTSRAHICTQICNKKLPCGTHSCQEICHPGLCGDCPNIGWTELTCHCGGSIMYPPIPCGARPPACHRPCRRAHDCGHPVMHECHDDTEKCAPCTVFVKKSCFCGSDSKDSVFCYLPGYSCGRICKRQLSCRQHTCKRVCHDRECEVPKQRGVFICSQPCPVTRFVCKHPCNLPCHGRTPCPATNCTKIIEIKCECGNRNERIECFKLSKDSDNRNKMAMLSMNRLNQDSVVIDLCRKTSSTDATSFDVNSSSAPSNSITKKLDCDETCAIYKRNKALAQALDIVQPDLKPTSIFGEDPLKLLKEATVHDYKFVAATYDSLVKFVSSCKKSERRFIFLQFPPAEKLKREVIHELAHHFNCTSESRDEEPQKFVIVRASKNKSCVPDFNIEQLLPIDD